MKRFAVLVGLCTMLMAAGFGQEKVVRAKIPFEFVAGAHTLPAGDYDFLVFNRIVTIKNATTLERFDLAFVTRIAPDNTKEGTARISYDVQDGQHSLEALWPEQGDGYLLQAVKREHTHVIVRSK